MTILRTRHNIIMFASEQPSSQTPPEPPSSSSPSVPSMPSTSSKTPPVKEPPIDTSPPNVNEPIQNKQKVKEKDKQNDKNNDKKNEKQNDKQIYQNECTFDCRTNNSKNSKNEQINKLCDLSCERSSNNQLKNENTNKNIQQIQKSENNKEKELKKQKNTSKNINEEKNENLEEIEEKQHLDELYQRCLEKSKNSEFKNFTKKSSKMCFKDTKLEKKEEEFVVPSKNPYKTEKPEGNEMKFDDKLDAILRAIKTEDHIKDFFCQIEELEKKQYENSEMLDKNLHEKIENERNKHEKPKKEFCEKVERTFEVKKDGSKNCLNVMRKYTMQTYTHESSNEYKISEIKRILAQENQCEENPSSKIENYKEVLDNVRLYKENEFKFNKKEEKEENQEKINQNENVYNKSSFEKYESNQELFEGSKKYEERQMEKHPMQKKIKKKKKKKKKISVSKPNEDKQMECDDKSNENVEKQERECETNLNENSQMKDSMTKLVFKDNRLIKYMQSINNVDYNIDLNEDENENVTYEKIMKFINENNLNEENANTLENGDKGKLYYEILRLAGKSVNEPEKDKNDPEKEENIQKVENNEEINKLRSKCLRIEEKKREKEGINAEPEKLKNNLISEKNENESKLNNENVVKERKRNEKVNENNKQKIVLEKKEHQNFEYILTQIYENNLALSEMESFYDSKFVEKYWKISQKEFEKLIKNYLLKICLKYKNIIFRKMIHVMTKNFRENYCKIDSHSSLESDSFNNGFFEKDFSFDIDFDILENYQSVISKSKSLKEFNFAKIFGENEIYRAYCIEVIYQNYCSLCQRNEILISFIENLKMKSCDPSFESNEFDEREKEPIFEGKKHFEFNFKDDNRLRRIVEEDNFKLFNEINFPVEEEFNNFIFENIIPFEIINFPVEKKREELCYDYTLSKIRILRAFLITYNNVKESVRFYRKRKEFWKSITISNKRAMTSLWKYYLIQKPENEDSSMQNSSFEIFAKEIETKIRSESLTNPNKINVNEQNNLNQEKKNEKNSEIKEENKDNQNNSEKFYENIMSLYKKVEELRSIGIEEILIPTSESLEKKPKEIDEEEYSVYENKNLNFGIDDQNYNDTKNLICYSEENNELNLHEFLQKNKFSEENLQDDEVYEEIREKEFINKEEERNKNLYEEYKRFTSEKLNENSCEKDNETNKDFEETKKKKRKKRKKKQKEENEENPNSLENSPENPSSIPNSENPESALHNPQNTNKNEQNPQTPPNPNPSNSLTSSNPSKIPENLLKGPENPSNSEKNPSKVLQNPSKGTEIPSKIPENLSKIPENLSNSEKNPSKSPQNLSKVPEKVPEISSSSPLAPEPPENSLSFLPENSAPENEEQKYCTIFKHFDEENRKICYFIDENYIEVMKGRVRQREEEQEILEEALKEKKKKKKKNKK